MGMEGNGNEKPIPADLYRCRVKYNWQNSTQFVCYFWQFSETGQYSLQL